ncbi:MAG: helix-turn-helix transcriptional regulator [Candidatus Hermodarchaeia archaeon]
MKRIEQLEKKGALGLLLFFLKSSDKQWMITEILARINRSQRTLYSALQILHQLQLVEETRKPEYNRRYFRLTDIGRTVASKLQEISDLLEQG